MTRLIACVSAASILLLVGSLRVSNADAADPAATDMPAGTSTPAASTPAPAAGLRSWELSPYRIQLLVHVKPSGAWTTRQQRAFLAAVQTRAQAAFGGISQLTAVEAPSTMRWNHAADPLGIPSEALPANSVDFDKLILLDVTPSLTETALWAREFDVRTRLWSPAQSQSVETSADLTQATLRTLWNVFRPVARIESVPVADGPQETNLRILGGDLPASGHGLDLARTGSLWQPIVRHTDVAGHTLAKGVFSIPLTWLQTLRVNGSLAPCRTISAAADPIDLHYDGRTEYLALAVNARSGHGTELTVLNATGAANAAAAGAAGDLPMEGLQILGREGEGPLKSLGRTDANGRLLISSDALTPLHVYIRSGDDLLLRLPVLCGVEPALTVRVEDNGRRPASARFIESARSKLIDLAAQQQVLAARLQRQLVAGKGDEAAVTFGALANLPTSDKFVETLDSQRTGLAAITADPIVAAWLDKQLANVKTLATQNLIDSATLGKLHDAVNKAK